MPTASAATTGRTFQLLRMFIEIVSLRWVCFRLTESEATSADAALRVSAEPGRGKLPNRESPSELVGQTRRTPVKPLLVVGALTGFVVGLWALVVRGALTLDLGVGRTLRPLGPSTVRIAAPRELVFEILTSPYLGRTPRALEKKLKVLERGQDMVLAAHFTQVGPLVTTTVETVRFEPPASVHFRLVRGPVPHVREQFLLHETGEGTELEYRGELGTDLWALGRWWGAVVARKWEAAVSGSLESVKLESERRAGSRR